MPVMEKLITSLTDVFLGTPGMLNLYQCCINPKNGRGFLKNQHTCFELSHSIESSLRSLSTL